ncbi:MAG: transketolase [Pyrinomonadaceae bacterium]|nr:transketolase [Pyrinomonadaceae bacterium]
MPTTETKTDLDQLCINTIRTLTIDAIQKANSGHPGLPLGMAPTAYVLWTKFLRHNPKNPHWFNRDRFVLSGGHGSMLIYSLLHLTGYESVSMDEIKQFRQYGSSTPGHPENHLTAGVEVTTGPLGAGTSNAVGLAIAEKHLAARYNKDDAKIVDNHVYAIVSDGDLQEGISGEASSLAGHLKLGNLTFLYDDNSITIDGSTELSFTENVLQRYEAYGWHTQIVNDGNNLEEIENAIIEAQKVTDKPSIIAVKTIIGFGLPKQGTSKAHSDAPGVDAVKEMKRNLGWDENAEFYVPDEVYAKYREAIPNGEKLENEWNELLKTYTEKYGEDFSNLINKNFPENWESFLPSFEGTEAKATRAYSGEVINAIADTIPNLIGGSADLTPSNNTTIKNSTDFEPNNYAGRNMHYGIREHAMGGIMNGIALYGGLIPFGGTFMTFSDYCRPAIRLASLSAAQTIFVFTHDSIGLGEDGPTHQSVEHLAALRAIPHLFVLRPADGPEVSEAWAIAINRKTAPTVLALSRQKVALIDRTKYSSAKGTQKGGYILAEASNNEPKVILIGTGSEIGLTLQAKDVLESDGIPTRVVSMPCTELFDEQSAKYRDSVLPNNVKTLAVEAGVSFGWHKYADDCVAVDKFGASAPAEVVFKEYGFTVENVVAKAKALL